ncbi:MAG: hypothetical protein ACK55I_21190, partial [bacterium]
DEHRHREGLRVGGAVLRRLLPGRRSGVGADRADLRRDDGEFPPWNPPRLTGGHRSPVSLLHFPARSAPDEHGRSRSGCGSPELPRRNARLGTLVPRPPGRRR